MMKRHARGRLTGRWSGTGLGFTATDTMAPNRTVLFIANPSFKFLINLEGLLAKYKMINFTLYLPKMHGPSHDGPKNLPVGVVEFYCCQSTLQFTSSVCVMNGEDWFNRKLLAGSSCLRKSDYLPLCIFSEPHPFPFMWATRIFWSFNVR